MAETSVIYRRPNFDEAQAMAALHVQCWREAYSEILPAELINSFNDQTRLPTWQSVIPNAQKFVLGAFDADVPVGFVISGFSDEKYIEDQDGNLETIYLAASHYRQGIGRELIGRAARDWVLNGGTSLTVGVLAENIRARVFYESLGAKLVRLTTYTWDGHDLPDVIYVFDDLPSLIP